MRKTLKFTLILLLLVLVFSCSDDNNSLTPQESKLEKLLKEATVSLEFNGDAKDNKNNLVFDSLAGGASLATDRKGNTNSAYDFDGVDDYIKYDNISGSLTSTSKFTISVWAKNDAFPSVGGFQTLFSQEFLFQLGLTTRRQNLSGGGLTGIEIPSLFYAINNQNPGWNSQTASRSESNTSFNGKWHHYIIQYNDDKVTIYLNTIEKATLDVIGSVNTSNITSFLIGAKPEVSRQTNSFFNGSIDDFHLFNKVLTEEEIKLLANDK